MLFRCVLIRAMWLMMSVGICIVVIEESRVRSCELFRISRGRRACLLSASRFRRLDLFYFSLALCYRSRFFVFAALRCPFSVGFFIFISRRGFGFYSPAMIDAFSFIHFNLPGVMGSSMFLFMGNRMASRGFGFLSFFLSFDWLLLEI